MRAQTAARKNPAGVVGITVAADRCWARPCVTLPRIGNVQFRAEVDLPAGDNELRYGASAFHSGRTEPNPSGASDSLTGADMGVPHLTNEGDTLHTNGGSTKMYRALKLTRASGGPCVQGVGCSDVSVLGRV